jgi:LCP family protein required for cell wall assembly
MIDFFIFSYNIKFIVVLRRKKNLWNKKYKIIGLLFLVILICVITYISIITISLNNAQKNWYVPIDKEKQIYQDKNKQIENKDIPKTLIKITNNDFLINNVETSLSDNITTIINSKESITFLLLGIDSRQGEPARSDTILVGKYVPDKKKILLFSIPRDTYVSIPDHGMTKVNHSYAYGEAPLTIVTLENFLHIKIDKYIAINFQGFRDLINSMGGLNIDVDKDMYYKDDADGTLIDLKKGKQNLNGDQTLGYSRFRHDAIGDIGRMKRQQQVIKEISNQLKSTESIFKLPEYISIIGKNLKSDFTVNEVKDYILNFMKIKNIDIEFETLTGDGGIAEDGLYYFKMDENELKRFQDIYSSF